MRKVKVIQTVLQALLAMILCCGIASAAEDDWKSGNGCWKMSLDSLPLFGDRSEDESGSAGAGEYVEPTEYTVDATGRKVPVRTERSGMARPIK